MASTRSAAFAGRLSASEQLAAAVFSLKRDSRDARPASRAPDGIEALRYAHAREATVHAARLGGFLASRGAQARAHVRVRANRLRLRPYRQCAAGDRVRRAVPAPAPPLW